VDADRPAPRGRPTTLWAIVSRLETVTQRLRRQRRLLQIALLAMLLVGCVAPPPQETPAETMAAAKIDELEQMAQEGRFLDAALAYSRLAADALPPQRARYALRAAELLMTGNYVPQAYQLMVEIDTTGLSPELQTRHAMLSAEISLARQLPDQALSALDRAASLLSAQAEAGDAQRLRLHQLRAKAYAQLKNYLEVARERVILEPLLTEPDAVLANQEAILTALQQLSPEAIKTLQTGAPPDVLSGWLELTTLSRSMEDARQSGADLVTWRERYPNHPAQDRIIAEVLAARPRVLPLPRQIALILPLNNRFAKAASAVRDGFLAAYYAQQPGAIAAKGGDSTDSEKRLDIPASTVPVLRLYDEGSDPARIDDIYQQAIDDGAEFVVGPLDKDAVKQLAAHETLPVPVLTLNQTDSHGGSSPLPDNLFQFSLSPEQEARQVAERAWLDGHTRAAIITPATAWGERVAKAFNQRWRQFGGHVVEMQTYDAQKSDYSLPIRRLLNVDESEQRQKELRRLLGQSLEFIPRRRQDIDFIFMAANARQARLIRPQLRFHHAPKVPVYATSHSYSGAVDADTDRDMDGVIFADMPWTLTTDRPGHALKGEIEQLWPNASKRYPRLYALGVDAYQVIGQLNTLRRNRAEFFPGATGDLYLDVANRLQRRLLWAQFQRGVPELMDSF
jgi:outer membrane PBP1 activator LpoA protein